VTGPVHVHGPAGGDLYRTIQTAEQEAGPTLAQYEAFASLFDGFNRVLFGGRVPQCVLTFQRHQGAYGYFSPRRWEARAASQEAAPIGEIALNPSIEKETLREVASTLVHEMVHAFQHAHGKPSRSGYHNTEWAVLMESIGLQPSDTGAPGGRRLGQRMSHYVVEDGPFAKAYLELGGDAAFLPFREVDRVVTAPVRKRVARAEAPAADETDQEEDDDDDDGTRGALTAAPDTTAVDKRKRTYQCPACRVRVWGKPELAIACLCTGSATLMFDVSLGGER